MPEMVDVSVQGVEDLVVEAVEGPKVVIRCISIGITVIAATTLVRMGYEFLDYVGDH